MSRGQHIAETAAHVAGLNEHNRGIGDQFHGGRPGRVGYRKLVRVVILE